MQPAALPQLLALLRFLEVAHGQPRRTQYQLTLGFTISGQEVAFAVDDGRFDQRYRHTGLDSVGDALILAAGLQFIVQVCCGDQRAGFRHAIRGGQLNAARQGGLVQRTVERTAADDDLPAAEVLPLCIRAVEQHLQDGRYAVGEGDLLFTPQLDQHVRLVAARVHLLHAKHGGGVGDAPGMHVEHRGDGHVHVVAAQQAHAVDTAGDRGLGQRVQHQLAVAEIHALGVTGGASGVEGSGHRVLVEIREVVARAGSSQQLLILADQTGQFGSLVRAIGQQQGLVDSGQLPGDGLVQADEVAVDQHHAVFGVVHGVEDLLRRQAHVDGVHHRADHRDGEHAFQVAMAVPVHHCHGITGLDPGLGQHIGQACNALVELWIRQPHLVAVDDFAGLFIATAGHQQALDQQWIGIGALGGLDDASLQHGDPFSEKRAGQVWVYCSSPM
ncbi:hypothetical protein D3C79_542920 [compost metagenome]